MIFKTHEANIRQIKGALRAFDALFFHGDGNFYPAIKKDGQWFSKASNDRLAFANPNQEEATYRTLFEKGDDVPTTVEELNKKLMDSKNQDILAKRTIKEAAGMVTFSSDGDDEVGIPASGIQTPLTPGADTNIDDVDGGKDDSTQANADSGNADPNAGSQANTETTGKGKNAGK